MKQLAIATLIGLKTADGMMEMTGVEIGKQYNVDVNDIMEQNFYNVIHQARHKKQMIMDVDVGKRLPLELLSIAGVTVLH